MASILGSENEIEIFRGASVTYELHVTDAEEEDVDLSGGRVVLSVKCDVRDSAPLIQKDSQAGAGQVELTHPREGKAEIKFVPSDTQNMDVGEYLFDVWVVLPGGLQGPVVSPSPFRVVPGVTVLT